jgi:hypothetical protein
MILFLLRSAPVLLAALLLGANASAAPVQWTLNDVVFDDGESVTGSFDYDADTNSYSNINIVTIELYEDYLDVDDWWWAGSSFDHEGNVVGMTSTQAWFLNAACPSCPNGGLSADHDVLQLGFSTALSNSGGTAVLTTGSFLTIAYDSGAGPFAGSPDLSYGMDRKIVSGTVSSVPIPAAAWLFGSALAGLGWLGRKRSV